MRRESIARTALLGGFLAFEFWPVVVVPLAVGLSTDWNVSSVLWGLLGGLGGWVAWELIGIASRFEDEYGSLLLVGWLWEHWRRPRLIAQGYGTITDRRIW